MGMDCFAEITVGYSSFRRICEALELPLPENGGLDYCSSKVITLPLYKIYDKKAEELYERLDTGGKINATEHTFLMIFTVLYEIRLRHEVDHTDQDLWGTDEAWEDIYFC